MDRERSRVEAGLPNLLEPPTRRRVLALLNKSGPCYFTELQKDLRINPNALAYNLRVLISEGKVERELKERDRKYVLYKMTERARRSFR